MINFGILGMNARNLLYIKKFNPKKVVRLADNKIKTKKFLSERGIPVAKTYGSIKSRKELYNFDFKYLPKNEFVVKPNKGSRGRGIYISKMLDNIADKKIIEGSDFSPKKSIFNFGRKKKPRFDYFYKSGGKIVDDNTFRRYLLDILDGKYSLTFGNDKILIEEKLIPGEGFKDFCEHGLADIRIIVFNLVPIAAMVRVPTKESGGKANLDRGGIGLGLDIGSGKVTSMRHKNKILFSNFPEEYKSFFDKRIPFWSDILLFSSKIQFFVNMGYLALDWVITDDGPKLLEINARAGLKVQNISNIPLRNRLDKVSDLKIDTPEKGVEIGKTLFTQEKIDILKTSKVIYLSQNAKINFKLNDIEETYDVIVEANLGKTENLVSKSLYEKIKTHEGTDWKLDLYENEIIFKNLKVAPSETLHDNIIILGKNVLSDYLLKPINKTFDVINLVNPEKIINEEKNELYMIDSKIDKIARKLNLSSILRPLNYLDELDYFITYHGNYNPKFKYNRPAQTKLDELQIGLSSIKEQIHKKKFETGLINLFNEKIEELSYRIGLVKAYKDKDFLNIEFFNKKLFGEINEENLSISKNKILDNQLENQELLGKQISLSETEKMIEQTLSDKGISGIDIIYTPFTFSRISVVMGKNVKIKISKGVTFREKELPSVLAHEIGTHLVRYLNGSKSGWDIFKRGTGYYLKDEEGLAIYNANKLLPEGYEKLSTYKKYFLVNEANNYSFNKIIDLIRFLYPNRPLERLFKTVIRMIKGIEDTSINSKGKVFMKDKVYLDGYLKVKNWVDQGGDIEKMYGGKYKIEDMEYM